MAESETSIDSLPEDCLSRVISFTSPRDACRSSLASAAFRGAAESDLAWEQFLPPDCLAIAAAADVPVEFASRKELFRKLSAAPLLVDGGTKTFWLDKFTNKKCYMLSSRELSIAWSTNSINWCWKHNSRSIFTQEIELIMVCWLQICGRISSSLLSPNTTYGAYIVFQLAKRAYGFGIMPLEVEVKVGKYKTRGTICMHEDHCTGLGLEREDEGGIVTRSDGWLEVQLREFYNDGSGDEVKMELKETKGTHLKAGLIVNGIELRPKY